jgi:hypothetical protein
MTDMTLAAAAEPAGTRERAGGLLIPVTRRLRAVWLVPGFGTWAGVGLIVTGMVLVALSWGITATEAAVTEQLPVLLSVGGGGLALVVIGVCVVNLVAKQADALARREQLEQLRELVSRLVPAEEDQ